MKEKLSIALNGKGAFRRFKETLHRVDEQWLQAWYQWRDKQLKTAVDEWLKGVLNKLDCDSLPFGIQLVGKRWNESHLLAMTKVLSEVTGSFRRPPGY